MPISRFPTRWLRRWVGKGRQVIGRPCESRDPYRVIHRSWRGGGRPFAKKPPGGPPFAGAAIGPPPPAGGGAPFIFRSPRAGGFSKPRNPPPFSPPPRSPPPT